MVIAINRNDNGSNRNVVYVLPKNVRLSDNNSLPLTARSKWIARVSGDCWLIGCSINGDVSP